MHKSLSRWSNNKTEKGMKDSKIPKWKYG